MRELTCTSVFFPADYAPNDSKVVFSKIFQVFSANRSRCKYQAKWAFLRVTSTAKTGKIFWALLQVIIRWVTRSAPDQ